MGAADGGAGIPLPDGTWTAGLHSPMSLLAHEVAHRWAAHMRFVHPETGMGFDSFDLLDSCCHWSFGTDTRAPKFAGDPRTSALGGNVWIDTSSTTDPALPFECAEGTTVFLTHARGLADG